MPRLSIPEPPFLTFPITSDQVEHLNEFLLENFNTVYGVGIDSPGGILDEYNINMDFVTDADLTITGDWTIEGAWTFTTHPSGLDHAQIANLNWADTGHTIDTDIVMADNSMTGVNAITFTDINGAIAGIENQNLLDKTAVELISNLWTWETDNKIFFRDLGLYIYSSVDGQLDIVADTALMINNEYKLPQTDGLADELMVTDGADTLAWKTVTVDVCIAMQSYLATLTKNTEQNIHGGMDKLDDAQSLSSGSPITATAKGPGKIILVINAGTDLVGDITITGNSVDRSTGTITAADTSIITIDALTTDASTTDANGNIVHDFTGAYITDKWFEGAVTISTTDVNLSDVDVWHVSFEQVNDQSNLTLNSFDINLYVTNASCEFDAYLHTLHVTGDKCDIDNEADLHIGSVGGAKALTARADKYYRLRRSNLAEPMDGSTDGFWIDMTASAAQPYVEDVMLKVWFTKSQILTLT